MSTQKINADLLAALKAMTEYMAYAEVLAENKAVFKRARAAIRKAEEYPSREELQAARADLYGRK